MSGPSKPNRRATEQFNIRMSKDEAALIRRAFPHRGDFTASAIQLLLDEARARLGNQPSLSLGVEEGGRSAA